MREPYAPILAAICWLCAHFPAAAATVIPDCAGDVEIRRAQVIRVEKNGALILSDGRAVLLERIRLALDHDGALADDALNQLRGLATAAPLTLTATPPKEDRYDRVRVQAFGATWLQMELLKRGLARVQISPDRSECAPDFYEAETAARAAHAGLWAFPAHTVRTSDGVKNDIGTYQIVEGRVVNAGKRDGRLFLDFSNGRGFIATVAPEDARLFRDLDTPLEEMGGRRVIVRGIVEDYGGRPEIALSNPAQIELLK